MVVEGVGILPYKDCNDNAENFTAQWKWPKLYCASGLLLLTFE